MKTALITGITGQDGSYLAELLLEKGYEVHGIVRRSSSFNTERLDRIYQDPHVADDRLRLHLRRSRRRQLAQPHRCGPVQPDEIYNLGAQSHVRVSFDVPEYTASTVGARHAAPARGDPRDGLDTSVRFYQASSSEMFGGAPPPQSETTPFQPRSPYACAKVFAHQLCHELPRGLRHVHLQRHPLQPRVARGAAIPFVTRKITRAAARIKHGLREEALPRQPRRQARLGLRRRLRRGDVADAPAGQARRLRHRDRRDALGARAAGRRVRRRSASTGRSTSRSIRATSARPRSTTCAAMPSKATQGARLEAEGDASSSSSR